MNNTNIEKPDFDPANLAESVGSRIMRDYEQREKDLLAMTEEEIAAKYPDQKTLRLWTRS